MNNLLVLRERFKQIYVSHSLAVRKGAQFLLALLVFNLINSNIGFMKMASSVFCTVGLAVVCTFLPLAVMTAAATVLIVVHLYTLSMPIAGVTLILFLLMYIFYFRFTPEKSWLILLTAVAFGMKIPLIIPVAFGVLGTTVWIVPASCGILAYYLLHLIKASATALKGTEGTTMIGTLTNFTKQFVGYQEMWVMLFAVVIGILVVNGIKNRPVDHSWKIASATGAAVCVIVVASGNISLGLHMSYTMMIFSGILGVLTGLFLEVLFFSVDYSRTENVQFEDDEYYYYVKAVPKVGVQMPEKKVKHITEHQGQEPETTNVSEAENKIAVSEVSDLEKAEQNEKRNREEQLKKESDLAQTTIFNDAKMTEEILLTRSLSKELGLDQNDEKKE